MSWFEVDKEGLAKVLRRRGMAFVLYELLQNSWDTDATEVHVELTPIPGRSRVKIRVQDNDPQGFLILKHGYVLFAESAKKSDPGKRGRFNLGEKMVIAVCEKASLVSTSGSLHFEHGSEGLVRRETKERLKAGSIFEAEIKMTRAELDGVLDKAKLLIPPVSTWINGTLLTTVPYLKTFEATLPTEVADADGYLKRVNRKTVIGVFQASGVPHIYEMGIPVVESELPWSINIGQKVPLSTERDNVSPAYRKALSVAVLNAMHEAVEEDHASCPALLEALESPHVSDDAVHSIVAKQHGELRVIYDPSDPESNARAVAGGYTVIRGGAYSKQQWANIKRAIAAQPAGQVFPTPQVYDPNGVPARVVAEENWTPGMRDVYNFARELASHLLERDIEVVFENEFTQNYLANYGPGRLVFNTPRLGKNWFDLRSNFLEVVDLLIHEFGHEFSFNHLSTEYHEALTHLGAKMAVLALREPGLFQKYLNEETEIVF